MIFYMLEIPNDVFSKIHSINNTENWLKTASNDTNKHPGGSNRAHSVISYPLFQISSSIIMSNAK